MSEPEDGNTPTRRSQYPELTSYQLVMGVCIALGVAVACFVCGFFLGSWRSSLGPRRTAREGQTQTVAVTKPQQQPADRKEQPSKPKTETAGEGTQTYPRPPRVELPAARPGTVESSAAAAPSPSGSEQAPHDIQPGALQGAQAPAGSTGQTPGEPGAAAAPSPAGGSPEDMDGHRQTRTEAAPGGGLTDMDKAPPLPDAASVAAPPAQPAASGASSPAPAPAPEPVPLPPPPKPPESPALEGGFGVQIASFAGANRQQAAEAYAARVASSDGTLKIVLRSSEDGKYVRAIVGPYPDRQTAETCCRDLRKRAEFKECFVKALP